MRKSRRHAAIATTCIGAVAFAGLLRQSGDTADAKDTMRVEIVDRCGNVVLDRSGKPVVVEVQLAPPPLEAVASPGTLAEQAPLAAPEQPAVPIPADTRQITTLAC